MSTTVTFAPAPAPAHTTRRRRQQSAVQDQLRGFFDARTASARSYGPSFTRLWTLAARSVAGGKLVRPMLMLDMFDALSRTEDTDDGEGETLIEIAAAVELLHAAFLMHDDVIDGDLTRRGCANLVGALLDETGDGADRTQPELHWARTGGILMGDLLLAGVHQIFARAQLEHERRLQLLDLLDHTITESVAGEDLDVGLSAGVVEPEIATILSMSSCKTAAYTFQLPLRIAAVLARAGAEVDTVVSTAGRHLGLAFQLQDDLLSMFGDPLHHGKDPLSDLREGKQTAIISYARRTDAWPAIAALFGRADLTADDGAAVRELLIGCGAKAFVEDLIEEQLAACRTMAEAADLPAPARRVLLDLVDRLDGRRS